MNPMKRALIFIGILCVMVPTMISAQVVPAQTFTAPGLDASPQQSSNCNTGTLQVSGTGTWTIVPQGSNDNGITYNTITTINSGSITTAGTFSGAVAGFAASFFRFNVTAVSGSVSITKSCTSQQLQGSGGGGGGGSVTQGTVPWVVSGTVTSNQGTTPWVVTTPPPTTAVALNAGTNAIGSITNTAFAELGSNGGTIATDTSNRQIVVNSAIGYSNQAPFQVSVTTTATQIVAARTGVAGVGRGVFVVYNSGAVPIYLGTSSGVTATTGSAIPAGGSAQLLSQTAEYGITASGTAAVSGYELY